MIRFPPSIPSLRLSFFTSGSTGARQNAWQDARTSRSRSRSCRCRVGTSCGRARVRSTVTHQHVYGLTFRLCWPLASGRPFTSIANEYWETALVALDREEALITSPAHLTRLAGIAPLPPARRPSLVLSAGAPLAEAAAEPPRRSSASRLPKFRQHETGAIAWRRRDRARRDLARLQE